MKEVGRDQKLFVIKKYIMARSAADAIRKERTIAPDDVWIDEDWRKSERNKLAEAIGFTNTRTT
jgi:hypothetical protein